MSFIIYTSDAPSESVQVEREREEWEREQRRGGSRSQRSVSRERWVESMVVADSKLIEYHGSDNVESYIFTIMNMVKRWNSLSALSKFLHKCLHFSNWNVPCWQVAGIFHDASIGNAIHVILVRLILLQGDEVTPSLTIIDDYVSVLNSMHIYSLVYKAIIIAGIVKHTGRLSTSWLGVRFPPQWSSSWKFKPR